MIATVLLPVLSGLALAGIAGSMVAGSRDGYRRLPFDRTRHP